MLKKEIIAEEIRNKIIAGELKEGKQVLGRSYAMEHRVNLKTAHEAVWILASEGYLYNRPGSGYFVVIGAREMAERHGMTDIRRGMSVMVTKAKALGLSEETLLEIVKNAYRE